MSVVLGVDVGGTFTDFLLWDGDSLRVHKRPSTPDDPSRAVLEGIDALGVTPDLVVHGSTVATNAVLERRGARIALVLTEGMRDLMTIGRQTRPDIYDLEPETPEPLVPDELLFELHGRLNPDGSVAEAPDHSEVREIVREAAERDAEAIAVSLLYSYANPSLEELFNGPAGQAGLFLSLSTAVSPEYREVERTATTALNAYVGPVMSRYVSQLAQGLEDRGCRELHIVQSDGGAASTERAGRLPVATLLSGPAAGVAGAFALSRAAGFERILTFDMGGTSTDVALCDAEVPTRADVVVGGLPARTPVVDVHTVGAGGGSIARLDAGGALRVGPRSAGAEPGPACYGRGEDFTVTDAQAVLGRLGGGGLLDGAMRLDVERARLAAEPLLEAFASVEEAAEAVIEVATANMERALRVVSVERGFDPREFTLVAFGGAGPLHACALAESLELPRVLVPMMPGVLAAHGAAESDLTATRTRSILVSFEPANFAAIGDALNAVAEQARDELRADAQTELALDLRYLGQSYELTVALSDASDPAPALVEFHRLHKQRFAHAEASATVEVVNVRSTARVRQAHSAPAPTFDATPGEPFDRVDVLFDGAATSTPLYRRDALTPGMALAGPVIVTQLDTTTLVTPGWSAIVDEAGNLLLERA